MSILNRKVSNIPLTALVPPQKILTINLSDYIGSRLIIIFYPLDFTVVCPTEINEFSDNRDYFLKRNTKILFVSCDSIHSHLIWSKIPRIKKGVEGVAWPMVSDYKKEFCTLFEMVSEDGVARRGTVILNKNGVVVHSSVNCDSVGRSVREVKRLVNAFEYVEKYGSTCKVDWDESENDGEKKQEDCVECNVGGLPGKKDIKGISEALIENTEKETDNNTKNTSNKDISNTSNKDINNSKDN